MKLKSIWNVIRFLPHTIYFNFRYLPLRQAIYLPILLYKPKLLSCKGSIKIESSHIKPGLIRLGFFSVSLYPNTGFTWENKGGDVIFKGICKIGNNSYVSIGEKGKLYMGENFVATTTFRLAVYNEIFFGDNVLVGWENTFTDTNFHKITKLNGGYKNSFAPIKIGNNNWLGAKCLILKGTEIPENCIIGAGSLLNKKYDFAPYTLASGVPIEIKETGVYRNPVDDTILY